VVRRGHQLNLCICYPTSPPTKFVYDPNKSGGAVAIQATRGSFRFVTGSQDGSYEIKSPYGTLGDTRVAAGY
jgi:hypothetical protein